MIYYVVEQMSWRVQAGPETSADNFGPDTRAFPDDPSLREYVMYMRFADEGGLPVRAFRDAADAERFCRQREKERRGQTNPFRYGMKHEDRSSLDAGRFHDWLLDADLNPPGDEGEEEPMLIRRAWQTWWEIVRPNLDETRQHAVARALHQGLTGRFQDIEGFSDDLDSLDQVMTTMDQFTAHQRQMIRYGLMFLPLGGSGFPERDGERDEDFILTKWQQWWSDSSPTMSAYQRHLVWEALDKVRFFRVVELTSE